VTDAEVLNIARDMIWTIFKCAMPLLLVSLIVGLIISIFQTVTSIQEQTQYLSDRHIDPGTDADLCAQAGGDLFSDTPVRKLDHEQLCGVSAGAL